RLTLFVRQTDCQRSAVIGDCHRRTPFKIGTAAHFPHFWKDDFTRQFMWKSRHLYDEELLRLGRVNRGVEAEVAGRAKNAGADAGPGAEWRGNVGRCEH